MNGLGIGASTLLSQLSGGATAPQSIEPGEGMPMEAQIAGLSPTMTLVLIAAIVGIGLLIAGRE